MLRISTLCAVVVTAAFLFSTVVALAHGPAPHSVASVPGARSYLADVGPPGAAALRLHVEEIGHGPAVVLIHGLGASSYAWRRIAPALARSHTVITIDLKGFGRSDKPFDLAYGPADQARLIRTFLLRRGIGQVSVVGHSFGGAVALLLALELNGRAGPRLDRLVLIDAPAFPQQLPLRYEVMTHPVLPYLGLMLIPPEVTAAASLTSEQSDPLRIKPADISAYARPFYEAGTRHALIATMRQFVGTDARAVVARYPSIRQPALVVWCRADSVVPLATGVRLTRTLPNARLHVLDRCDHVPTEEQPEVLGAVLGRFLR